MSKVDTYVVQPVILPPELGLAREFYDPRSHLPGRPLLNDSDYDGYEKDTIFYDVFFDKQERCLRALGPPLVNLEKTLLPLETFVSADGSTESTRIKHSMKKRGRVVFHMFKLPHELLSAKSLLVRFRFANSYEVTLNITSKTLPFVYLQFTTLQKNNPVEWILDWMKYCQKLGVERLLLYDNGSNNYGELAAALRAGPDDLDVILISWPFNFGPIRSYYNNFCQAGENNHAHQCLGYAKWCGHFDLDEYPVLYRHNSLPEILKHQPEWIGLLRIDNYLLPNILNKDEHVLPTVRDFLYRNKLPRKKGHKYIVRTKALKEARVHNGEVKLGYFRRHLNPEVLAFFHYMSLTTNWKPYANRKKPEGFDPNKHRQDSTVIDVLLECCDTPARKNKQPTCS